MTTSADNWTRDADGNYVHWNKPPFKNPGSGRLSLLLPGEKRLSYEVHIKRIKEYQLLELKNK